MRARTDAVCWIDRSDADDLLAVRVNEARALRHHAADEVLLGGHHLAHAEVARGGGAVQFAAGHVALLDAHDGEGFHAIGRDAEFIARLHHRAGNHGAVIRRNGQFVGVLAREGEAEQARRDAVHDGDLEGCHVRHRLVRHHEVVHQLLQRGPRLRPRHRHLCPLLGDRDIGDVEIGEQCLVGEFHLRHDLGRIGRGCGHHIVILGEARGGAVVIDDAVLTQHEAVARLADAKRREGVAVELVEEGSGILALHVDLAQRRDIAEADGAARGEHLARRGCKPVLALSREPGGAHPQAGFDEDGTLLFRPVVQRRLADGLEVVAGKRPGEGAEGDRRVEGAEGGGAHLVHGAPGRLRQDGDGVDVAELALVGGHAGRRIALGELDVGIALARGERQVLGGGIVLVVDEGLAMALLHPPQGRYREGLVVALRDLDRLAVHRTLGRAVGKAFGQQHLAGGGTRDREGRAVVGREEGQQVRVPHRLLATVAGEVDDGAEAAGHGNGLAVDVRAVGQVHRLHGLAADSVSDHGAADDGHACGIALRVLAAIHNGFDVDAMGLEVARGAVDRVVTAENDDGPACRCRIAVGIGAHGGGRHHARHVVAAEGHRALFRTRRKHCAPGVDLPVALARLIRIWHAQMVADALHRAEDVAVEPAHDGGARQQGDVRHGGELGDGALCPFTTRSAADLFLLVQQRATEG